MLYLAYINFRTQYRYPATFCPATFDPQFLDENDYNSVTIELYLKLRKRIQFRRWDIFQININFLSHFGSNVETTKPSFDAPIFNQWVLHCLSKCSTMNMFFNPNDYLIDHFIKRINSIDASFSFFSIARFFPWYSKDFLRFFFLRFFSFSLLALYEYDELVMRTGRESEGSSLGVSRKSDWQTLRE